MSETEDQSARSMGGRASAALDALEMAIWNRSVALMHQGEKLHNDAELTPERSHTILVSLLEQRKIFIGLKTQISQGVKAVHRINRRIDVKANEKATEDRVQTHGRNRFVRSKVGQIKT